MAYHEYTSFAGQLVRRSYNGRHFGKTPQQEGEGVLDRIYEGAHPDSRLWANAAREAMEELAKLIGDANYRTWAELVWPGETVNDCTWREICEQADEAFSVAYLRQVRDVNVLAEAAKKMLTEKRASVGMGA